MKATHVLLIVGTLALGGVMAQGQNQTQGPGPQGPGQQRMMELRGPGFNLFSEAANVLGVTPRELRLLMGTDKTLAQVAKDLNVDQAKLESALVAARNKAIDQAVQAQRITAEQATQLKANSQAVVKALVQQKAPQNDFDGPGGHGTGMGRGPGH